MWVEPNTNIRLLHNVPLDTTYDHTILFQSQDDQTTYFLSMTKYAFLSQSYQRVRRGVARLQRPAEDLYDCNYMMFQNTAFGNKWFYAFVKSVEYVNNVTSEITFEIDVLQTWHFDYQMDICFIERQHAVSDGIGEHIEAEPLAIGEYVFNGWQNLCEMSQDLIIIVAVAEVDTPTPTPEPDDPTPNPDPEPTPVYSEGKYYNGIFGGITLYCFHGSEVNALNALISSKIQTPDAIQAIWMCPNGITAWPSDHKVPQSMDAGLIGIVNAPAQLTDSDALDGYVPKNNKLYTYPYNYYHVDNNSGKGLDLRYEFFQNLTPTFQVNSTITMPVQVMLRPTNYKSRGQGVSYDHADHSTNLMLDGYPQCSWNMDYYWAWVAQNAVPEMYKLASAGVSSIVSTFLPWTSIHENKKGELTDASLNEGAGTGALTAALGSLSRKYTASISADICRGNISSGNINVAKQEMDFYGTRVSVNRHDAKQIDDFFSRFGYAIGRLQLPDRNARPCWTYLKTAGCTLTGSVPCDDMAKICSIYDNGITWWNNPNRVGHYEDDNSPRHVG